MTTDELIRQARTELANLPQDELVILYDHFGTKNHQELARRIAEDARDLWSPSEASGVEPEDWVPQYIRVTIDLFHDQRRVFEAKALREGATELVDSLKPEVRSLICCMVGTMHRGRVATIIARLTNEAIAAGVVDRSDPKGAIQKVLEVHLEAYVEEVDATYFPSTATPRN